jgi:hypothetical protein
MNSPRLEVVQVSSNALEPAICSPCPLLGEKFLCEIEDELRRLSRNVLDREARLQLLAKVPAILEVVSRALPPRPPRSLTLWRPTPVGKKRTRSFARPGPQAYGRPFGARVALLRSPILQTVGQD